MKKKHSSGNQPVLAPPNIETDKAAAPAPQREHTANGKPSQEEIRLSAYLAWEAAGKPAGDGMKFWVEAERQFARHK